MAAKKIPAKKPWSLISEEKLRQIYTTMQRCAMLQERLRKQKRSRRGHGSASLCARPEAILAGSAIDLLATDTIVLPVEDAAAACVRGVPLREIFASVTAKTSAHNNAHNLLTPTSPAALLPMSLGLAWSYVQQKNSAVVVVYWNHASVPADALQEALRYASAHKLPMLFVCATEQAVAPHSAAHKKSRDFHVLAHACGVPGIPVDGSDAVAIYRVAFESLQRARNGGGPTLMEAMLLPQKAGATADSCGDPLIAMERYLEPRGLFNAAWKKKITQTLTKEMDRAATHAKLRRRTSAGKPRSG